MAYRTLERLGAIKQDIDQRIWEGRRTVPVQVGPLNDPPVNLAAAKKQRFKPIKPHEAFGQCSWAQRWFRVKIPAAARAERGRRVLFFHADGKTTAYLDGQPWAGLDMKHRYCALPDTACTLWLNCGLYQTCIRFPEDSAQDLSGGLRFRQAAIACRNQVAWETGFDLEVLLDLLRRLQTDANALPEIPTGGSTGGNQWPPIVRRLTAELDAVCDQYFGDLTAFRKVLLDVYRRYPAEYWQPGFAIVGQSHLDLLWLWPEATGRQKAVHTTATALRLLDRYPEFTWTWSQPAMLAEIERAHPAMFRQLLAYRKQGRVELTGALEVEVDTQIPCGEALVRSIVYGQRQFAAWRDGEHATVMHLPDTFGFSACLPQLMVLAGVTGFYTCKISGNQLNRFPYTSFTWRGPDGSGVLAHIGICIDRMLHDRMAADAPRLHQQAGVHDESLTLVGWGDGGGGPEEAALERARRRTDLIGTPRAKWTHIEAFFDRMEEVRPKLPVFQGELFFENHRGVHTSQGRFKQAYWMAEQALRVYEAAAVLKHADSAGHAGWKRLLFAQFHDCLPGTSIREVYDAMTPELQGVAQFRLSEARRLREGGGSAEVQVFNPLSLPRRVVVSLSAKQAVGAPLRQPVGRGRVAESLVLMDLPALATTPVSAASATAPRWELSPQVMDNGRVRARFDRGQLVELDIAWKEDQRLLKYHLPTAYLGRCARYGTPFGSIQRPQIGGQASDEAMFEVNGNRWAAVCDDSGEGAAILAEARYGYSCRDGELALSLLRAPRTPDATADRGSHRLRFAIGRHREQAGEGALSTAMAADVLFAPAVGNESHDSTPQTRPSGRKGKTTMTPHEIVRRTIEFDRPERLAMCSDYVQLEAQPTPRQARLWEDFIDDWGCGWTWPHEHMKGICTRHPLPTLDALHTYAEFPHYRDDVRYQGWAEKIAGAKKQGHYLLGRAVKAAGGHWWIHSCGKINELIEGMIQAGFDVVNNTQPRTTDPRTLAPLYKGRGCILSGSDIQVSGTDALRLEDADTWMETFGDPAGGFIYEWSGQGDLQALPADSPVRREYQRYSEWSRKIFGQA